MTRAEASSPQLFPTNRGQLKNGKSLCSFSTLADGARDLITSTGFNQTIGKSQMSRDSGASMIHPRPPSHDAPLSFKSLRNIPRSGGEVGEKFGSIICERNENAFYHLRALLSQKGQWCLSFQPQSSSKFVETLRYRFFFFLFLFFIFTLTREERGNVLKIVTRTVANVILF